MTLPDKLTIEECDNYITKELPMRGVCRAFTAEIAQQLLDTMRENERLLQGLYRIAKYANEATNEAKEARTPVYHVIQIGLTVNDLLRNKDWEKQDSVNPVLRSERPASENITDLKIKHKDSNA